MLGNIDTYVIKYVFKYPYIYIYMNLTMYIYSIHVSEQSSRNGATTLREGVKNLDKKHFQHKFKQIKAKGGQ